MTLEVKTLEVGGYSQIVFVNSLDTTGFRAGQRTTSYIYNTYAESPASFPRSVFKIKPLPSEHHRILAAREQEGGQIAVTLWVVDMKSLEL